MVHRSSLKIAVLGAGMQGSCTALELAGRGYSVDLIEREDAPLQMASRWNEGKIHLGHLYANDPSERTAALMINGAQRFAPVLGRYISYKEIVAGLSQKFVYAVHKDSLFSPSRIGAHLGKVEKFIRERKFKGRDYFGDPKAHAFRRLSQNELEEHYNPETIVAAFETHEVSINTADISKSLSEAVTQHPNIKFLNKLDAQKLRANKNGKYFITVRGNDVHDVTLGGYDIVVNALWTDRMHFDADLGIHPKRKFLFRHKLALHITEAVPSPKLLSTTLVLGQFGDIVVFSDRGLYLSWYPAGLTATSNAIRPPRWDLLGDEINREAVSRKIIEQLDAVTPHLDPLCFQRVERCLKGGTIFSWGMGDIDDLGDEVHQRIDIGIHSRGNYHSVDTGKYSMAPYFAEQLARLIDEG